MFCNEMFLKRWCCYFLKVVRRIDVVSFVSEVSGRRGTEHKGTNVSGRVCGVSNYDWQEWQEG